MPRARTRYLRRGEHPRDLLKPTCEVWVSKKRRCRRKARAYVTKPWHKWTHEDLPQPKWYCREHAKEFIDWKLLKALLTNELEQRREVRRAREREKSTRYKERSATYVSHGPKKVAPKDQDRSRKGGHGSKRLGKSRTVKGRKTAGSTRVR